METLILVLGLFSSATLIMSGLSTDRKRMLLFGISTNILGAVTYALNHSTLTLIICCIGITRSLFALASFKYPVLNTWPFLLLFLSGYTSAFVLSTDWNHFVVISAFPVVGAYLGSLAVFFKRMTITKALMISSGLIWLTYEFTVGFFTQMIGESFTLFANVFAFVMIIRAEQAGASEEDLQTIDSQVIHALTGSIPVVAVREALTGSLPVIKVTTNTKPLPVVAKVSGPVSIPVPNNFPETGNLQQVPA